MKIAALYENRCDVLATAQVSGEEVEGSEYDLEATLQFVKEDHAVEFDFSAFCLLASDRSNLNEEKQRILTEIAAVNRLVDQVNTFHSAFTQAANAGLDYLDSLA